MKYDPQKANNKVFAEGEYFAEVYKAEECRSKQGNEMLKVTFRVHGNTGTAFVTDYIVSTAPYKLKKLAVALGIGDKFETGAMEPEDLEGGQLIVKLVVETNAEYPDKNVVKAYLPKDGAAKPAPVAAKAESNPLEDDLSIEESKIPF